MEGSLFRCLLCVPSRAVRGCPEGPDVSSSPAAVLGGDRVQGAFCTQSPPLSVCSASWYFCIRVLVALYVIDKIIYT